jgi:hypothetical protein
MVLNFVLLTLQKTPCHRTLALVLRSQLRQDDGSLIFGLMGRIRATS